MSTLYTSIIQSHIDYCLSVWGNCSATQLKDVQKIQNRAARIITKTFDYNADSSILIRELGWQTVAEMYHYFTSVFLYKCQYQPSHQTFAEKLTPVSDIQSFNTRSSANNNLHLPKPRTNFMKRRVCYQGSQF